jgi:hypothetical protein
VQSAQGDLPSALSSYKKDVEIAQKLVARDPVNTDWQRDLLVGYETREKPSARLQEDHELAEQIREISPAEWEYVRYTSAAR